VPDREPPLSWGVGARYSCDVLASPHPTLEFCCVVVLALVGLCLGGPVCRVGWAGHCVPKLVACLWVT
jgi:hypothetical protein